MRINNLSLVLAFGLTTAVAANAQEPVGTMHVHCLGGEPTSVPLTTATHITFDAEGEQMLVSQGDTEPLMFPVGDIDKILFDLKTSSVDEVRSDLGGVTVTVSHGVLTLESPAPFSYGAWNAAGVTVANGKAESTVTLDFTSLPAGVYIVRAGGKTVKFTNK